MNVDKEVFFCLLAERINGLVQVAHGNACRAGWWGVVSGGDGVPLDVNLVRTDDTRLGKALVAQKLCLIHSEISEAMEGHRKGLMDDKLPHRKMIEVELADAMIRIADLAGALGLDLGGAIVEKMEYNANREDHKLENRQKAGGKAY
ncbi:MAG: Burkholderia phage BcepB1A [Pseudomonadota bacterium]|jgi:NTP pyrophosphatase (non-canonical NTP hydrolase)